MSEIAISIQNVSKYFRLYASPKHRFKEALHPFKKQFHKKHWVFRDLSLEIKKGEFLGIIGRNGCGKSTLLKLISGVLTPSSGAVSVNGSISALLELGSGMNPEFTGMQNIFFYGTILGLEQSAIDDKLDEIISFADIGEYIDQPLKRYSSGMKARLSFSVASHLTPDILIIDEVLAVGDIFFRQKCNSRIEQLLSENITVLLVSHNLTDVSRYCSRALFLHNGKILFDGGSRAATLYYQKYFRIPLSTDERKATRSEMTRESSAAEYSRNVMSCSYLPGWELPFWPSTENFLDLKGKTVVGASWTICNAVAICDSNGHLSTTFAVGDWVHFFYEFVALQDLDVPIGYVRFITANNIVVHGKATFQNDHPNIRNCPKGTVLRFSQRIQLNVQPGSYIVEVGIDMLSNSVYENLSAMSQTEIAGSIKQLDHLENVAAFSVVWDKRDGVVWRHLGLCDLPGSGRLGVLPSTDSFP